MWLQDGGNNNYILTSIHPYDDLPNHQTLAGRPSQPEPVVCGAERAKIHLATLFQVVLMA